MYPKGYRQKKVKNRLADSAERKKPECVAFEYIAMAKGICCQNDRQKRRRQMLKKKVVAVAMLLMMVISLMGGSVQGYAAETTEGDDFGGITMGGATSNAVTSNLQLGEEVMSYREMVAGETFHMRLELTMKEGYCIDPVFTITPKNNAPLTIYNIKVSNEEKVYSSIPYMDGYTKLYLEYDVAVSDFAQIGIYEYGITFEPRDISEDYYEDVPLPGELIMNVAIVSEKTRPQISVIAGGEVSCKAGDTVTLNVTLKNEGELKALNTYVFADYEKYEEVLTPLYSSLNQKIGSLGPREEKVLVLTYKISESAATQRIKIPLEIEYKLANGVSVDAVQNTPSNAFVYLNIKGSSTKEGTENIPVISNISQSAETPKAGEKLTMSFDLENKGETDIRDAKVVLKDLRNDGFLPLNAEPYVEVGTIEAGTKKKVDVTVQVGDKISEGFNKLSITVQYSGQDAKGNYESRSPVEAELYVLNVINQMGEETPKAAAPYVKNVTQSPELPVAGEKLTMSFYVVNDGAVDIREAKIVLDGLGDNSFLPTSAEPYISIGTIPAGAKKKVDVTVQVGDKISEGFNRLNFTMEYQGMSEAGSYIPQAEAVELYVLNVQNPDEDDQTISRPKLMVSNFYTDVEEVKAGSIFDFTFEILNTNDSIAAKNIKVTVTGASNAFSVTAGGNSFFVDKIQPQESAPITINLKASAATTTGAYPIMIKIEYEYEGIKVTETYSGETVQEEILLQVKENLRPSVENVYVGSWDTPLVNQPTTMSFEFYNMGKSTLNNTYVTVEGDFMLSNGSNSYYIGNIAAGMPEYIEFDVVPLIEGTATGKMIIHMEDSNGDEVTMEKEFTAYIMGEMSWDDMGYMDPGYMDPGFYEDPSMQTGSGAVEKPILPPWLFLCIQGAILVIVIPVTRAIRLAVYRRKIKQEDAI